MSLGLLSVPAELLQDIAFELFPLHASQPPVDLLNLLLSCSTLHAALNKHNCPYLYAETFRVYFDLPPFQPSLPDTALADELISRYHAMQFIRRAIPADLSVGEAQQRLGTLIMMALEDSGRNRNQLVTFDITEFYKNALANTTIQRELHLQALVLWFRVLTLTEDEFRLARSAGTPLPSNIDNYIFSFLNHSRCSNQIAVCQSQPHCQEHSAAIEKLTFYLQNGVTTCLNHHLAAMLIRFAWEDAVPHPVPPILPATREEALAMGVNPCATQDDCRALEPCTPFSQTLGLSILKRDVAHLVHGFLGGTRGERPLDLGRTLSLCKPGILTAVWEGIFMQVQNHANYGLTFIRRTPMQIVIQEHNMNRGAITGQRQTAVSRQSEELLRLHDDMLASTKDFFWSPTTAGVQEDDWLIHGETLRRFEEAWGGYEYTGRARPNGPVTFVRRGKPDSSPDTVETLLFQGHLILQSVLVGVWTSRTKDSGIFCVRRVHRLV